MISALPNAIDLPAEWSGLGRYLVAHDYNSRRTNVVKAPSHIVSHGRDEVCNRGSQRTLVKFGETVVYPGDWVRSYSVNTYCAFVLLPDLTWVGVHAEDLQNTRSRRDILRVACDAFHFGEDPDARYRSAEDWMRIIIRDNTNGYREQLAARRVLQIHLDGTRPDAVRPPMPPATDLPAEWADMGRYLASRRYPAAADQIWLPTATHSANDEVIQCGRRTRLENIAQTVVYPGDYYWAMSRPEHPFILLPDLSWERVAIDQLDGNTSRLESLRRGLENLIRLRNAHPVTRYYLFRSMLAACIRALSARTIVSTPGYGVDWSGGSDWSSTYIRQDFEDIVAIARDQLMQSVSNIQIDDVQIIPATPKPTAKPKATLTLKRNAWLQQKPAED